MKKYMLIQLCLCLFFTSGLTSCSNDEEIVEEPTGENPDPDDDDDEVEDEEDGDDEGKIFEHPGLLHNNQDFERMKTKVNAGAEPWISGWNVLIENSHAQLSYNPNPVESLIRGGNSQEVPEPDNYGSAMNDVAAAYQTALRWKISGDEAYAEKSIEILNAWASTTKEIIGNSNRALAAGIYGYQFANAAEIMRTYEGWADEDFEKYQQWMIDVFYPINKEFLETHYGTCISHYWANWDLANLASTMAIGVLTDDQELYNYALDYLKTGLGNGNLNKAIYYIHDNGMGQLQESGRDQGHSLLAIGLMGEIAEMAYSQGDDIYGYDDNRILKGAEYSAAYNFANLDVPFEAYENCAGNVHNEISDVGKGNKRPIWALLYNHYVVRKGLSAEYTKLAADFHSPEGGGGDYGPNSGGFDTLGFGTLVYTLEE